MRINEIVQKLIDAREAYYNGDSPIMSDEEFDRLEEELKKLDFEHEYFSSVGVEGDAETRITHMIPMLSMGKAKNVDGLEKWMKRLDLSDDETYIIEPKIDGISASSVYENGKLQYVATRGNGIIGQDISHVSRYIDDIKKTISFDSSRIEVRGELYIPKDTEYETENRPLRNICSGLINRKEAREDQKYIRFAAYQISGSDFKSENEKIEMLLKEKFHSIEYKTVKSFDEIKNYYNEYLENLRSQWLYETDGLIVAVNDNNRYDEIDNRWIVDHHHHYAIAIKPPSESRNTTLQAIEWQVSRQGNLVPVAVFDRISIGGANIERATLNNYTNVIEMNLHRGDTLAVERANDVIPYVKENLSKDNDRATESDLIVDKCPSCERELILKGVHIVCNNPQCSERNIQKIKYWVMKSDIEFIAEASIRTLYDRDKIKTISDLYKIEEKDFEGIEGFADKKISKFLSEIADSRKMTAPEFISKLGIPLVQKKSLMKLNINSIEDFYSFKDDTYVIGQNIIAWKLDEENMALFNELIDILDITESKSENEKELVAMTGKGHLPRKELIKEIEEKGYIFSSTVTAETVILICEDPEGTSSKLQKARKNKTKLISYREFFGK